MAFSSRSRPRTSAHHQHTAATSTPGSHACPHVPRAALLSRPLPLPNNPSFRPNSRRPLPTTSTLACHALRPAPCAVCAHQSRYPKQPQHSRHAGRAHPTCHAATQDKSPAPPTESAQSTTSNGSAHPGQHSPTSGTPPPSSDPPSTPQPRASSAHFTPSTATKPPTGPARQQPTGSPPQPSGHAAPQPPTQTSAAAGALSWRDIFDMYPPENLPRQPGMGPKPSHHHQQQQQQQRQSAAAGPSTSTRAAPGPSSSAPHPSPSPASSSWAAVRGVAAGAAAAAAGAAAVAGAAGGAAGAGAGVGAAARTALGAAAAALEDSQVFQASMHTSTHTVTHTNTHTSSTSAAAAPAAGSSPQTLLTVGASSDPQQLAQAICVVVRKHGSAELHSISFPNHYMAVKSMALAQEGAREGEVLEATLAQLPLPFAKLKGGSKWAMKLAFHLRFVASSGQGVAAEQGAAPGEGGAAAPDEAEQGAVEADQSWSELVPEKMAGGEELTEHMRHALNQQGSVLLKLRGEKSVKRAIKSMLALQRVEGWRLRARMSSRAVTLAGVRRQQMEGEVPGVWVWVLADGQDVRSGAGR